MIHVLELGNFIVPSYAGMLLREQGASVEKWANKDTDPTMSLRDGEKLWHWLNAGKHVTDRQALDLLYLLPSAYPDIVIDNFRPQTLETWGIVPAKLARKFDCVWVSMYDEMGERSFDMVAQMRSWAEYGVYAPFYVGDTAAGLWMAFKALAMHSQHAPGHYVLGQAGCLQKLVEGELLADAPGDRAAGVAPWDAPGTYYFDREAREGVTHYKGCIYREPVRDTAWKRAHLWHKGGRIII
jgi:hypothetical protein